MSALGGGLLSASVHMRLVRRARWRLAFRASMLVMAMLALLSAAAWVVARQVLYGRLYERLERVAESGRWQQGLIPEGYFLVTPPSSAADRAAPTPAAAPPEGETAFSVAPDARYGALAVLRWRLSDGRAGQLATPARDYIQALATFAELLGCLTLTGGLGALPAGYFLAGRALQPLGEAIQERSEFVALASHRLRTPLSVIRTSAELALAGQGVDAPEALHTILGQTEQMEGLADRLTALARADARAVPDRTATDLSEVARRVVEAVRPATWRTGGHLRLLAPSPVWAAAPAPDMTDALTSVLENALRFTPAGRAVTVRTGASGRWATIEVADEGPGIHPGDLAHVTEPFFQGRHPEARGGSGLGLAIASATLHRLGGRLHITSHLGEGTTVRLSVRRAPPGGWPGRRPTRYDAPGEPDRA